MNIIKAYIPLSKVDEEQRMVFGYASTEALDSQGEIIARAAIEEALPEYMRFGNIREMHTMSAVGVAKSAEVDEKGLYIGAKVVDEVAWAKVKEGVYKGFSIGGRGLAKADNVITKMRLTEISLVDRPANPECVIDCFKADGAPALSDEQKALLKQVEALASVPVTKGMYTVSWAADLLSSLNSLQQSAEWEAAAEGENSPIPATLKQLVADFAQALRMIVEEETKELVAEPANAGEVAMGDKTGDVSKGEGDPAGEPVAKAGARYSKATKAALAKVHGMLRDCDKAMAEMGYESAEEDDDNAGGTQKSDGASASQVTGDFVQLAKGVGIEFAEGGVYADLAKAAIAELAKAQERIKALEDQPEPAKAAVNSVAVEKAEDTNGNLLVKTANEQPKGDPNDPNYQMAVLKAALGQPIPVVMPHLHRAG